MMVLMRTKTVTASENFPRDMFNEHLDYLIFYPDDPFQSYFTGLVKEEFVLRF